jgi:hypothetical protein
LKGEITMAKGSKKAKPAKKGGAKKGGAKKGGHKGGGGGKENP